MRRRLVVWGVAALVAVATVAALALLVRDERGAALGSPVGADGFAARVSIAPRSMFFGDPVVARLDLLVDRTVLEPAKVRVATKFAPFTSAGATSRTETDLDRFTRIRLEFPLECLTSDCVPETLTREFTFGSTIVRHDGRPVGLVDWPQVTIASRVGDFAQSQTAGRGPQAQQTAEVPWRASIRLRAPTFAVEPNVVATAFAAAAVALLVASLFLLQVAFPTAPLGFRRLRRVRLTPLERALVVLERAHARGIEREQRLALDRLAHELRTGGQDELAGRARRLAWQPPVPDEALTAALATSVRDVIAGRANGGA